MVKQDQLFYPCLACQAGTLKPCAVAPSFMAAIFVGCKLSVVNQDIGVLGIVSQNSIQCFMAMFQIRCVDNHIIGGLNAIPDGALGMIQWKRINLDLPEPDGFGGEFHKPATRSDMFEAHGKVWLRHLPAELLLDGAQVARRVERHLIGRIVERREERNTLNVVPMKVGQKDAQSQLLGLEFPREGLTQISPARTAVEYN